MATPITQENQTHNAIKPGYALLKNGLIVDGTGNPGFRGDLLIKDDKIEDISSHPIGIECDTLDCSHLVIAPGFIDLHSHMDWVLPIEGRAGLGTPFIDQGCTTMVTGNCGFSPAGFRPGSDLDNITGLNGDRGFRMDWDSMTDYFRHLERIGLSHNVVQLVGHGTTRTSMRGLNPMPLDREEMKELLLLLEEAMDQGAAGVSFGLGYEPGIFATQDEIRGIAELTKKKEKVMTVHGRAYSIFSGAYPLDSGIPHNLMALREMIDVARDTGVRLQYSHLMFAGSQSHPTYRQCLEELDLAIEQGVDVMTDTYPYHCGLSVINVFLPAWFLSDIPANYHNRDAGIRLEQELAAMSAFVGFGFDDIQLAHAGCADLNMYNGMFVDRIAEQMDIKPHQALLEISRLTQGRARVLNHNYSTMEIVDTLMAHPLCLFMSDSLVSPEGVQNPASYGTFPLFLQYARNRGAVSMARAVNKMTGASAERLNLKDRGVLRTGWAADITVFDWENVQDNNNTAETDRAPTGIEHVFINGRAARKHGRTDDSIRAGVVVMR